MRILIKALGYTPLCILYLLADILYLICYYVGYRREIVRENLAKSLPNHSEQERLRIEKAFYRNFCDLIVENFKLYSISEAKLKKRVRLLNPELLEDYKHKGIGAIVMGAHYCNWEWMALALSAYAPQDLFSVYKPLSNKAVDKLMLKARSRFGAKIIPMKIFPKVLVKNKDKACLHLMLADQTPHKSKIEFSTGFLSQKTPVFLGPEKLKKAGDLAMIFVDMQRIKRGYYEMKLVPLLAKDENESGKATEAHVRHLEKLILDKPENWLWSHRRWKYSKQK